MRRVNCRYLTALVLALTALFGCQRIQLYEMTTEVKLEFNLNLDMDIDLDLSVDTDLDAEYSAKIHGVKPQYVEVLFYDMEDHHLVRSHILPAEGGTVEVPSGNYNMTVYSFGTESTQISNTGHRLEIEAFTSDITKTMGGKLQAAIATADTLTKAETRGYEDDPIIHEPDHLYVANENDVHVPAFYEEDKSITIQATASSIIDVYSLEVLNIKGAQNIEKVEAFITGQIKSHYIGKAQTSEAPATLYTDMRVDAGNDRLYCIFGTFGKLTGEDNHIYLDITVTDSGGGQYRYIFDVTEQFDDPGNDNNALVIDAENVIDIPDAAHGGGGLAPSVGEWENENIDLPLG